MVVNDTVSAVLLGKSLSLEISSSEVYVPVNGKWNAGAMISSIAFGFATALSWPIAGDRLVEWLNVAGRGSEWCLCWDFLVIIWDFVIWNEVWLCESSGSMHGRKIVGLTDRRGKGREALHL